MHRLLLLTLLIASGQFMTACQRMQDAAPSSPSLVHHADNPIGKPTAPIDVSYHLKNDPVAGEPLNIIISLRPKLDAQRLTVHYTLSAGLASLDSTTSTNFDLPTAGQSISHAISVLPQQQGRMYVNVFVTLFDNHNQSQSRAFSIPVNLGNVISPETTPADKANVKQDSQGNPIIIYPAKELHK